MQPLELVRSYLPRARAMQIATVDDGQPWICTVYFVEDDELNLYWLSWPSRRHSQEIARHNKVAVAVPIKFDKPVIGIQAEGTAEVVTDKELVAMVMQRYVQRYGSGEQFYDNFAAGRNQHVLFKFTPSTFVLFDEVNFPTDGRQEIKLG
jgi:uncharacterized protein YhbP (UPF0306 family)